MIDTIIIATENTHKRQEFEKALPPLKYLDLQSYNLTMPEEKGEAYKDIANQKALWAARSTNVWAVGDDSGLEIQSMGNFPGIFSKRWAEKCGGFEAALSSVLVYLPKHTPLYASFYTFIALASPTEECIMFSGTINGTLIHPGRGHKGFGYDPYFQPLEHTKTFGEMDLEEKLKISHRGKALRSLGSYLKNHATNRK